MDAALHGDSVTALGQHGLRSRDKLARIPVKIVPMDGAALPKPPWLHAKPMMSETVAGMAAILREHRLHSVCEEAMCPNIGECFAQRTATFMIMGGICTRRCAFCDVAHGRPEALDSEEPERLADAVAALGLRYVVITSVDRDDLRDGGAAHFAQCIALLRERVPGIRVEVLTPDFAAESSARSMRWPARGPMSSITISKPYPRYIGRCDPGRTIAVRSPCSRRSSRPTRRSSPNPA